MLIKVSASVCYCDEQNQHTCTIFPFIVRRPLVPFMSFMDVCEDGGQTSDHQPKSQQQFVSAGEEDDDMQAWRWNWSWGNNTRQILKWTLVFKNTRWKVTWCMISIYLEQCCRAQTISCQWGLTCGCFRSVDDNFLFICEGLSYEGFTGQEGLKKDKGTVS